MTTKIELEPQAKEQLTQTTLKKAIAQFYSNSPPNTNYYLEETTITERTLTNQTYTVGFWHRHPLTVPIATAKTPAVTLTHNLDFVTVESHAPQHDDTALWIGAQLEGIFQVTILVQNAEKLGKPIGWKCAYCGEINSATNQKCQKCSASRGW